MLGLIFGLMVMGCPTEDNSKKDDGPETIAAEYQGLFKVNGNDGTFFIELTKNRFIDYWVEQNETKKNIYFNYAARNDNKDIYFTVPNVGEKKAGHIDNGGKFHYTYTTNGSTGRDVVYERVE